MPKILINEKDRTSPGTPASYANYSVLIPGFMDREAVLTADAEADKTGATVADKIQPDANGVYEFSSAQDFKDTIGWDSDENVAGVAKIDKDGEIHYGKRMALELLNLGYTIVYKPMESVQSLNDVSFWEDFYDKASYDFRFVSHGLLSTSYDEAEYERLQTAIKVIEENSAKFDGIIAAGKLREDYDAANPDIAYENAYKEAVTAAINRVVFYDYTGMLSPYGEDKYENVRDLFAKNADGKIAALAEVEEQLDNIDGVTPGIFNSINGIIANLACYRTDEAGEVLCGGRGDCTALIELDENCYIAGEGRPEHLITDGINNMSNINSNVGPYCALTVPSVFYKMSGNTQKFPGAFHYLACFMNSLSNGFAEWYAAAGYTRGVASYVIDHTSVKLGEIAINALEPRNIVDQGAQPKFACNVIANFRGSYYLWGNRTAAELKSAAGGGDLTAEHFLNIRQLCTTIKKQLYVACRRFTFDPNSDTLWYNFVNAITPTLDTMKANQGVRDYKIIKVYTDKKATLKAKIRIIPIEAVEDFDLEVSLEDSFGETSAVVTE